VNIVFAGTPAFASAAFNAIIAAGFNVVAAYTQPDRPSGRGMKLTPSPVKLAAQSHNVAVLQPASLKLAEAHAALAALKPDVMVVAAYGLILPQAVLDIPTHGCLNIHASLLPRWRGAAPIHRAILAGDTESGVCIMQMEAGLDTGPVLLERRTAITANDTTGTLHDRLAALGAEAIVSVLTSMRHGTALLAQPQPTDGVTYAHKISPDEAKIDWSQSAAAIDRQVRAFNPAPGAWTTWRGETLKIWQARVVTALTGSETALANEAAAGTVIAAESGRLHVASGSNLIELIEVQRAGGKRISASAWLAGAALKSGERFE
jgi:methionyl-tRNA formyltransferase